MNKKQIVALATCISTVAIAVVGGTLAYFTDTDTETNTFTVGNVSIDLIESQYHRVNAGRGNTTEAEPLQGGYLWASGVTMEGNPDNTPNYKTSEESWSGLYFSDKQIEDDARTYKNETDGYFTTHSKNMMPGSNVRKNPYVKNTGSNDAYIRVRVLVPVSLFDVLDNGSSYWVGTALKEGEVTSNAVTTYTDDGNKATNVKQVTRGEGEKNVSYYEFDFTYTDAVKPGEITFWNVWSNIAINPNATADDLEDVKSFNVIFEADAIQADGFANADDAFKAFDGAKTDASAN